MSETAAITGLFGEIVRSMAFSRVGFIEIVAQENLYRFLLHFSSHCDLLRSEQPKVDP
jgi:hypothetical protein